MSIPSKQISLILFVAFFVVMSDAKSELSLHQNEGLCAPLVEIYEPAIVKNLAWAKAECKAVKGKMQENCCLYVDQTFWVWWEVKFNLCVDMIAFPKEEMIELDFLINGHLNMDHNISYHDSSPVCVPITIYAIDVAVCFQLYDIKSTEKLLHACAKFLIYISIMYCPLPVIPIELGCFNITPTIVGNQKGFLLDARKH